MPVTREKKQETLEELKELLTRSTVVIFSDYRGLTASQMHELRKKLRPFNSKFLVAKNTLVSKALSELGMPHPTEMLEGPTALGFCFEDFHQPLRTMMDFAQESEILKVKGGLMGEHVLQPEDVKALMTLPEPAVLRAEALGAVQSPLSGLVSLLDTVLRELVYVLDARAEQLGKAAA
ncbi:MAG: 50S ribosomal protein L10 [Chloroflexi bacterium]|nr:50S ribosomal protein L10 [Chloroflexota bacterium]